MVSAAVMGPVRVTVNWALPSVRPGSDAVPSLAVNVIRTSSLSVMVLVAEAAAPITYAPDPAKVRTTVSEDSERISLIGVNGMTALTAPALMTTEPAKLR